MGEEMGSTIAFRDHFVLLDTEMKLEEFSKSKNELKIKNLKFKFN